MVSMAVEAQFYPENLGISLGGSSQELMDAGDHGFYQFSVNLQMQQQLLQNQQRNQALGFGNNLMVSSSVNNESHLSLAPFQSLAGQVEKHKQDIDQLIGLQNEKLRFALQEQRKQHSTILLKKLELRAQILLRQKDEDIARATKRTLELEDCLRRVEMENQAWQRVARENEAMVVSLANTLEQMKENVYCFSSGAEDAESCCDYSHHALNSKDREDDTNDAEQQKGKMVCKSCNSRSSCFLFLPCRHLCSCKSCEAFLDSCPVCKCVKNASIEVFMF